MRAELEQVVNAVREFYAHETFLLEKELGERTMTHRLAVHLERQFRRLGSRLRLQPARRARVEAAAWIDHFHR